MRVLEVVCFNTGCAHLGVVFAVTRGASTIATLAAPPPAPPSDALFPHPSLTPPKMPRHWRIRRGSWDLTRPKEPVPGLAKFSRAAPYLKRLLVEWCVPHVVAGSAHPLVVLHEPGGFHVLPTLQSVHVPTCFDVLCCSDGDLMQHEELRRRGGVKTALTADCVDTTAAPSPADPTTTTTSPCSPPAATPANPTSAGLTSASLATPGLAPASPAGTPRPLPAALLLLTEGGAGAWWSSFGGLVDRWMAAQASEPTGSPCRVLAALFVSDAPADNDAANGVMEQAEARAQANGHAVVRDVTVALMNGARRYLFATCVVGGEATGLATKMGAWAERRGKVV